MKFLLPFLLLATVVVSCSKSSSADDRELPVIILISPANNQVFSAGETVNISGTLSDNQKLTEVHVHISNVNTAALLIDIHRYPAAATYNLNESFQTEAGISYKIQVIAKDNSANENHAAVEITSN